MEKLCLSRAWVEGGKWKTHYEINFNKCFIQALDISQCISIYKGQHA